MNGILEAIFKRRAVKVFEPVEISERTREQILNAARHAPSSFNSQPYRFYWIETAKERTAVAELCMRQMPAKTASALVVVVADIGSLGATSQSQLEWMRSRGEFSEAKIRDYERTAKIGRILFTPGPFGIFGALKRGVFWLLNLWKAMGIPPQLSRTRTSDSEQKTSTVWSSRAGTASPSARISAGRLIDFALIKESRELSIKSRTQSSLNADARESESP